jgi:hypothetical protein
MPKTKRAGIFPAGPIASGSCSHDNAGAYSYYDDALFSAETAGASGIKEGRLFRLPGKKTNIFGPAAFSYGNRSFRLSKFVDGFRHGDFDSCFMDSEWCAYKPLGRQNAPLFGSTLSSGAKKNFVHPGAQSISKNPHRRSVRLLRNHGRFLRNGRLRLAQRMHVRIRMGIGEHRRGHRRSRNDSGRGFETYDAVEFGGAQKRHRHRGQGLSPCEDRVPERRADSFSVLVTARNFLRGFGNGGHIPPSGPRGLVLRRVRSEREGFGRLPPIDRGRRFRTTPSNTPTYRERSGTEAELSGHPFKDAKRVDSKDHAEILRGALERKIHLLASSITSWAASQQRYDRKRHFGHPVRVERMEFRHLERRGHDRERPLEMASFFQIQRDRRKSVSSAKN